MTYISATQTGRTLATGRIHKLTAMSADPVKDLVDQLEQAAHHRASAPAFGPSNVGRMAAAIWSAHQRSIIDRARAELERRRHRDLAAAAVRRTNPYRNYLAFLDFLETCVNRYA